MKSKKFTSKKLSLVALVFIFLTGLILIINARYSQTTYKNCGRPINNEAGYEEWSVKWSIKPPFYECVYNTESASQFFEPVDKL